MAAWTSGPQSGLQDGFLAFRLPLRVVRPKAMTDFRIARKCTGPAAGHVSENHVERILILQVGRVGEAAVDSVAEDCESFSQLSQALMTAIAGNNGRSD